MLHMRVFLGVDEEVEGSDRVAGWCLLYMLINLKEEEKRGFIPAL